LLNCSEPDKEEDLLEKLNTDTTDFTWNAKRQRRHVLLVKNQTPSRLIWEIVLLCQKWLEISLVYITVKFSTQYK